MSTLEWLQVGFACCIILSISSVAAAIWMVAVMAELRLMVEMHEDKLTPSFAEEHNRAAKPKPAPGPKTVEDVKRAAKVPPSGAPVAKEFVGADGKAHTFNFGGDGT